MSKLIGNYIHANYGNYLRYGILTRRNFKTIENENFERPSNAMAAWRKEILKEFLSLGTALTRELLNKIEKMYNFIENPLTFFKEEKDYEKFKEELVRRILDIIDSSATDVKVFWDDKTGIRVEVTAKSGAKTFNALKGRKSMGAINPLIAAKDNVLIPVESLKARYESLLIRRQKLLKSGTSNKKLEAELNELINEAEKFVEETTSSKGIIRYEAKKEMIKGKAMFEVSGSYLDKLNKALDNYHKAAMNAAIGEAEEISGVVIPLLFEEYITNRSDALVEETAKELSLIVADSNKNNQIVSALRGAMIKKTSNFAVFKYSDFEDDNIYLRDWYASDCSGNKIRVSYTLDKVDIMVTFFGGIENVSVKNSYNPKSDNFHLASGSDFLNYVQEYGEYVNHYLNIVQLIDYNNDWKGKEESDIKEANTTLALALTLKALMGGVFKLYSNGLIKKSDYALIFHTTVLGKTKLYSTTDIMEVIYNDYNDIFNKVTFNKLQETTTYKTEYVNKVYKNYSDAYKRIYKLLNTVSTDSKGFTVTIKKSTLNEAHPQVS